MTISDKILLHKSSEYHSSFSSSIRCRGTKKRVINAYNCALYGFLSISLSTGNDQLISLAICWFGHSLSSSIFTQQILFNDFNQRWIRSNAQLQPTMNHTNLFFAKIFRSTIGQTNNRLMPQTIV